MQDGGALDGRRRMKLRNGRCGKQVQDGKYRTEGAEWEVQDWRCGMGEGIRGEREGWAGSDSPVRPHFLEPFDSLPLNLSLFLSPSPLLSFLPFYLFFFSAMFLSLATQLFVK